MNLQTTINRVAAQASGLLSLANVFASCAKEEKGIAPDLETAFKADSRFQLEQAAELISAVNHLKGVSPE
jgi:hypothetical protein